MGFEAISNNSGNSDAVALQLSADITSDGPGLISFKFNNAGPIESVVTDIYWDDADMPLFSRL